MESYEIIWKDVLPCIQGKISTINYSFIIEKLVPVDLSGTKLVLMTRSNVYTKLASSKILDIIKSALAEKHTGVTDVEIVVGENKGDYISQKSDSGVTLELEGSQIDPQYTFDNFVVGGSNRYLYAAAKAVAEDPGNSYNPLFIYGSTGLGKTHIMHAIANYINIHNPSETVLYSTCEKFTNDLIATIRSGKAYSQDGAQVFRNRYRNVDVLIIDDVQFLAKKQSTQEEFFHTFNELYGANKQIILSADCDPKEIQLLDDRLKTRFDGGLKAQVLPPDIETKIAIVQKKAEEKKHLVGLDVATFIAERSGDNVRSLEGMLNKVIFASILDEVPVSLKLATEVLASDGLKKESSEDVITTTRIIDEVCAFYDVQKADLLSKKRNKELVKPRQVCMYLMTDLMPIPLDTIGQAMDRDHATVIYAKNKIDELMKVDNKISVEVNDIKNLILKK